MAEAKAIVASRGLDQVEVGGFDVLLYDRSECAANAPMDTTRIHLRWQMLSGIIQLLISTSASKYICYTNHDQRKAYTIVTPEQHGRSIA